MVEAVMYHLMLEVPRAMAIWTGLIVLAFLTLMTIIARPNPDPGPLGADTEELRPLREAERRQRLAAKAQELIRYAEEVAVAADRANNTAQRRREEWLAAQNEVERAWRAFDAADNEVRRLSRAAAFPPPRTPRTPAEYADRERYLHRAAMRACSHGQLSALRLSDVLAHRAGWDPRRHPVEQELILQRVIREELWSAYQSAVQREREAWHAAGMAVKAARSLRQEATSAALVAQEARRWLPQADVQKPQAGSTRRFRLVPAWRWRAARAG